MAQRCLCLPECRDVENATPAAASVEDGSCLPECGSSRAPCFASAEELPVFPKPDRARDKSKSAAHLRVEICADSPRPEGQADRRNVPPLLTKLHPCFRSGEIRKRGSTLLRARGVPLRRQ